MHSRRDDPKRGRRLYCSSFSRTGWAIPVLLLALQSTIAEAQSPTLAQTGRWRGLYELGPPYPNGYPGVHAAVLKGPADLTRALLFGQTGHFGVWSFVAGDSFVPPAIGVNFHGLAHPAHHLFCAGHATLNGRLVIVGGQYQPEVGTETAYEFNPLYTSPTETVFDPPSRIPPWQQLESTARGRWYATVTGLPTNQLLATSGTKYGYHFVFGGDTGSLSNDLRPLSMGGAADWAAPVTETLPPSVLPPVARKDHSAIMQYISTMDPHLARMVIFGGQIGPSQKTNDLSAQYLYGEHDSTSFW